jgi:integrase
MPSSSLRVPNYRRHKPTGQAVVTLNGCDFYLGKWNTATSRKEYKRIVAEWLARDGNPPSPSSDDLTVSELVAAYWRFAKRYYGPLPSAQSSLPAIKSAIRHLKGLYGHTPARDFGPIALKAVRVQIVASGVTRNGVNNAVDRIKRIFRWAVAEEMLPAASYQALTAVPGLARGHTNAPDKPPVTPVGDATVNATLNHLSAIVADMVRLQRLTGARPDEICRMRPDEIDRSGEVWQYKPMRHKTEHHGQPRVILIGPRAQEVLRPYLLRAADAYCFCPAESEAKRRADAHARRATPLSCGNRPGTNRKRRPKRTAGDGYDTWSYRRAIHRACDKINRTMLKEARELGEQLDDDARLFHRWSPNRLRHAAATELRKRFGIEAAQLVLGHASPQTTLVYAERDLATASKFVQQVG